MVGRVVLTHGYKCQLALPIPTYIRINDTSIALSLKNPPKPPKPPKPSKIPICISMLHRGRVLGGLGGFSICG